MNVSIGLYEGFVSLEFIRRDGWCWWLLYNFIVGTWWGAGEECNDDSNHCNVSGHSLH